MATGVTKSAHRSVDATSARSFKQDASPLPPSGANATLEYPNKAQQSEIVQRTQRRFLQLEGGEASLREEIPRNAYVLDDNFYALNALIDQGTKVTLYYLDPPYGTGFDFHSRACV